MRLNRKTIKKCYSFSNQEYYTSFDVPETLCTWSHGWTRAVFGLMLKTPPFSTKYLLNDVRSVIITLFSSKWLGLFSPKHVIYAFCAVDTTSWFPCEFLNFSMILMVYNSVVYMLTPTDEAWCRRCRRKSVSDRSRNTKCRLYFCDSFLKTFTCGMGIQDRENWSDYVGIWDMCSWW